MISGNNLQKQAYTFKNKPKQPKKNIFLLEGNIPLIVLSVQTMKHSELIRMIEISHAKFKNYIKFKLVTFLPLRRSLQEMVST